MPPWDRHFRIGICGNHNILCKSAEVKKAEGKDKIKEDYGKKGVSEWHSEPIFLQAD